MELDLIVSLGDAGPEYLYRIKDNDGLMGDRVYIWESSCGIIRIAINDMPYQRIKDVFDLLPSNIKLVMMFYADLL